MGLFDSISKGFDDVMTLGGNVPNMVTLPFDIARGKNPVSDYSWFGANPMYNKKDEGIMGDPQGFINSQRDARDADLARGRIRGMELFGEPMIDASKVERSSDMQDIINRRKADLEGMSSAENNALRGQMLSGVNAETQGALRQLRTAQGGRGLKGGSAIAQSRSLINSSLAKKAALDRDLMIQNIAMRQSALDRYQSAIQGAETTETARYGNRRFGQLSTELGYGQLGATERGAANQVSLAQSQLNQNGKGGFLGLGNLFG